MKIIFFFLAVLLIGGCAPTTRMISIGADEYMVYDTNQDDTWWHIGDDVNERLQNKARTFCGDSKVVEAVKENPADKPDTVPDGSITFLFRCTTPKL